jgi:hypothetical protein
MAAMDDLTELVERAAVAEKAALSSKWKEESEVQGLIRRTRKAAEEQRQAVRLDTDPHRLSPRWASLQQNYLDLGAQPALPGQEPSAQESPDNAVANGYGEGDGDGVARRLSHQGAAQAELDAVAAVGIARMALTDAAQAVLQARLARIQAGEDQSDAPAVDGHVPLHGRNAVSRHGPALAHGITGEIKYVLTRKPRNTVKALGIALGLGLLYLGYLRVFKWDQNQQWLPYLGLWVIAFVVWRVLAARALVERLGEAFMLAATSQLQIGASCRTLPCRVPSTPPPAARRGSVGWAGRSPAPPRGAHPKASHGEHLACQRHDGVEGPTRTARSEQSADVPGASQLEAVRRHPRHRERISLLRDEVDVTHSSSRTKVTTMTPEQWGRLTPPQ